MTWNDFAHNEKKAILKSAMILAQAKGRINYSQNMYLNSLLIRMNEPQSIIGEANSMWKFTMRHVLKSMNLERKRLLYLYGMIWQVVHSVERRLLLSNHLRIFLNFSPL